VVPAVRFRLAGVAGGLFTLALVVLAVGRAEGTEVILFSVPLVLFVTVMVRVNWQLFPTVVDEGTSVMRSDFHVHWPTLLSATVRVLLPDKKEATTLLNASLLSVVKVVLLMILKVKSCELPAVILSPQVFAEHVILR
jgi:hypothetical protein